MAIKRTTKKSTASVEAAPAPVKKRATAAHRPKKETATAVTAPGDITQEVASLAYFLWLDRGKTEGHADTDWLRAEQTVKTKYGL